MFSFLKQRKERKDQARRLCDGLAREALSPEVFARFGVPDTLDGRFDILSLYIILAMRGMGPRAAQDVFDCFFAGVERSLREIGVGDLSVPRHMKRMMAAFNGRRSAYMSALQSGDRVAMAEVLRRNLYGTLESPDEAVIAQMAEHVFDRATLSEIGKAA